MHVHPTPVGCIQCRCYAAQGEEKSPAQDLEKQRQAALKELEPLKLPGDLAQYTGNVMYPNEESAVWDVDGKEREGGREGHHMYVKVLWSNAYAEECFIPHCFGSEKDSIKKYYYLLSLLLLLLLLLLVVYDFFSMFLHTIYRYCIVTGSALYVVQYLTAKKRKFC